MRMKFFAVSVALIEATFAVDMNMATAGGHNTDLEAILETRARSIKYIESINQVSCPTNPTSCASFPSLASIYDGSNGVVSAYNLSTTSMQSFLTLTAAANPPVVGCSTCSNNNCVTGCVSATYHATSSVATGTTSFWSVTSNGIPNYYTSLEGQNIAGSWYDELSELGKSDLNPNAVMSQSHFFCIPKTANVPADGYWGEADPMWTPMGSIGVSINGIPVYNEWADAAATIAAMTQEQFDSCNAHPDGSGTYHYHQYNPCVFGLSSTGVTSSSTLKTTTPDLHAAWLQEMIDTNNPDGVVLVGVAFDGFPIYGPLGFDAITGKVRLMTTSYTNQVYIASSGSLDDCNGIDGPTPEYPDGVYHYHTCIKAANDGQEVLINANGFAESVFPYAIAKYHGVPQTCNFVTMGPPPTLY